MGVKQFVTDLSMVLNFPIGFIVYFAIQHDFSTCNWEQSWFGFISLIQAWSICKRCTAFKQASLRRCYWWQLKSAHICIIKVLWCTRNSLFVFIPFHIFYAFSSYSASESDTFSFFCCSICWKYWKWRNVFSCERIKSKITVINISFEGFSNCCSHCCLVLGNNVRDCGSHLLRNNFLFITQYFDFIMW